MHPGFHAYQRALGVGTLASSRRPLLLPQSLANQFGRVWPTRRPGVEFTGMETFHFLMNHWSPRDVLADPTFERPDLLKSLTRPAHLVLN